MTACAIGGAMLKFHMLTFIICGKILLLKNLALGCFVKRYQALKFSVTQLHMSSVADHACTIYDIK